MITYGILSDKGKRKINEDYTGVVELPGRSVFLLADGLGGHGNGDYASRFVVEHIRQLLLENPETSMEDCIQDSQDRLLGEQKRLKAENSMKTTITALEVCEKSARFLHVGDSRIYYFRKNRYYSRSLDHSVPQMLCMSGRIREKDIRGHEDRSKLIKVMGMIWNAPKYDGSETINLGKKDAFLLCSDGFWELLEEKTMSKLLKKAATPEEWLSAMEREVLRNGAGTNMDNYSAIAVMI